MRLRNIRPVYVAVGVAVVAYLATSGGAALIPFKFGQDQLRLFFFPRAIQFEWMTTLGRPIYWLLFLLTIVVLPVAAIVTEKGMGSVTLLFPELPLWIPLLLAGAMIAFCVFKLAQAGGLSASEAWDPRLCYEDKILRRVELFRLLGNRYYSFVYSSLPIIGCYLLARGLIGREMASIVAFIVVSSIILWLDVATIQKAPPLLYVLVIGLTLMLSGFGLVRSTIVTVGVGGAIYLVLALNQFCTAETNSRNLRAIAMSLDVARQATSLQPPLGAPELPGPVAPARSPAAASSPSNPPSIQSDGTAAAERDGMIDKGIWLLRSAVFRMAVSFPYYVQIFADPAQRCGVVLPPLGSLVAPRPCYPGTKVFPVMYPEVKYTTGSQPAGVSLSGYAEAGPPYAVLATVIAGVFIGLLSAVARGTDPASVVLQVVCCLYAYYVTQVPLAGTLLDSYGLFWLVAPIAAMCVMKWMAGIALSIGGAGYVRHSPQGNSPSPDL
ncbi:hypothetical protein [Bradyrhizobium sp.]|uniref:hypothetical protein n=1 Tax=Bradyrhizobium sp. TaxID=376 RepID=UPI0023961343|nr:hypothetical protein [Bradyrhizobium sp.]MDE2376685.1 hypothetical protein [Bradyrhizobium sp.]